MMRDTTQIDPSRDGGEDDVERTVFISPADLETAGNPTRTPGNMTRTPGEHGHPAHGRKEEVDDLVGGVDINPYISLDLDVSSRLESSLDTVDAKYALLTEFAEGGTAKVFIARDRNLRRLVAVKSLKKDAPNLAEHLQTFVTEAKVTAQLDHPGIIPIYGLFRDGEDGIHLVMKLVDGRTLREYLRNLTLNFRARGIGAFNEKILLRKRLELFLHVCDTISYAHHRSVIHRDLKPENIMIGKYMEVYVMDWGLARVISEDDAPPPRSAISGTPRYFAPEVLRGERLDLRSDIFTLGLILQEVVTLQYAVGGNTDRELIDHALNAELAPIEHRFGRKIDKSLQTVIRKATASRMEDRYQTVDDLAEDLRRYMGGLPVSAEHGGVLEKLEHLFHL